MYLAGNHWNENVLHALGAGSVAEDRNAAGTLLGYTVEPDIDLGQYEAAAAGQAKTDLAAYARSKSYDVRIGGTAIDGVRVKTDPDSLTLINGMVALAKAEPERLFSFDTGTAVASFDAAAAISLATAVGAWVQSTFDARATVLAAVEAGTVTTRAQIDAAFSAI